LTTPSAAESVNAGRLLHYLFPGNSRGDVRRPEAASARLGYRLPGSRKRLAFIAIAALRRCIGGFVAGDRSFCAELLQLGDGILILGVESERFLIVLNRAFALASIHIGLSQAVVGVGIPRVLRYV